MENITGMAAAVGKIPSGLFIVTTLMDGKKEGFLGSWIQQVSFSPLLIQIAIRPGRPCYRAIRQQGRFCVNVVGQKNGGMMKPFWNPDTNPDPFSGLEWSLTERGNVMLASGMAVLECETRGSHTPGDHEIVFAEVMDGRILQPEDKPLTHTRKSGLVY